MLKITTLATLLFCIFALNIAQAQTNLSDENLLISHVEWSPDNHILLTLRTGGAFLLDPYTDSIVSAIAADMTGPIEDAALQPNGSRLAIVDRTTGLSLWDLSDGSLIYNDSSLIMAWQTEWSVDGRFLLTGNFGEMFLRDLNGDPLSLVASVEDDVPRAAFSPNGQYIAFIFSYGIEVFDTSQHISIGYNIVPGFKQSVQWSADGATIIAAVINRRQEGEFYNVYVIDPFMGEITRTYSGFPNQLTSARWSPDETQILATSIDGTVYLVDAASGEIQSVFMGSTPILAADWSPYGGQIAVGAPAIEAAMLDEQITTAAVSALPIQILVPDPTPARLAAIATACDAPPSVVNAITAVANAEVSAVASLDASLTALETTLTREAESIPPACAADLLAVAEALAG